MTAGTDPVAAPTTFVSTGALPDASQVQIQVDEAHRRCRGVRDGEVSSVYPALAVAEPDRFGVCVVATSGATHVAGDADVAFPVMSVAKPFVFALVCDALGAQGVRRRLGVNATGLPFNSVAAVERAGGPTNPMVNPGAIAAVSLAPGDDADGRWRFLADGLSRFAGRPLELDVEVLDSALATNHRNHAIARLLESFGALGSDPAEATEVYTRACSLSVTARDLAVMGATLADGGVNPVTGEQVVDRETCRHTLAVMATAGMYETSGDWLFDVGMPAKSGIGGGIVTVAPGKGALGTYSPRLDPAGNSVRGQLVAALLARSLGLDLFSSDPAPGERPRRTGPE
ncbi:MAG TPA: glutaminase A [Acidimicrobiales bacterium]|nr:glutaminase A [Acidimicrobiales bacterium]